ncbi:MAG TPA: ABC transporter permease [Thermoanaerobaculia bacterium]
MIRHLLKLVWNRKRANALIIGEILLSFLVLFAVLTSVVSFASGWGRPVGFDRANVWVLQMDFDFMASEKGDPKLRATFERVLRETASLPQVEAAGGSNTPPYSFSTNSGSRTIDGKEVYLMYDDVTDGFAKAMGLQPIRGRWFNAEDDGTAYQPVVLDANAARAAYGDADPIGKTIAGDEKSGEKAMRVVGVVPEYRKDGESMSRGNMVFRRVAPNGAYGVVPRNLMVRVRPGTSAAFEETLLDRVQRVAPEMSFNLDNLERMRRSAHRFVLAPVIIGGIIALFLISMVALGLTGVLWQNVTKRTRELGLRRAMGASGSTVRRQILAEVGLLATIALAIGLLLVLQLPVVGIFTVFPPSAFVAGIVVSLATVYALTLLCGLYPSWFASRLQPADALRYE